jgi:cytochrome P450
MVSHPPTTSTSATSSTPARCPIDHAQFKTPRNNTEPTESPITQDADANGVRIWHINDYDLAKTLLRGDSAKQAGFKAELLGSLPNESRRPILYQEGPEHLEQRKQTAKFFTPKAVSAYQPIMAQVADQMVADLQQNKRADLRQLSLGMAMRVVSEVVGLTNSTQPGIEKRLDAFFGEPGNHPRWHPKRILYTINNRLSVLRFFQVDVKPAIAARKQTPKDDLISYLIGQNYKDWEIFTECVTYAAAGMVTTREFIALALWHLMEQPQLRERYLVAGEDERHAILHEVLRLEPIVSHLKRRMTEDVTLKHNGQTFTLRAGDLVQIDVQAVNADESVVGESPQALCPGRELHKPVVMPSIIGFGDGHHRCPGAYVALQETDVLLQRLLRLGGLRIEREPELRWSSTASGYELHHFIIGVD